ncbi:flagellar protein FlaG [Halopseudomonas pachastrellae]|uniref:flagellar protein FlaG n=1 Tax=Halopseudomonas pachastrellae TaxID=254161 RepID=UPI003D7C5EC5|tara:strand:+ start:6343 stop:6744 length:402 start_codon:yes stop_codon:yes gene_type:complete
MEMGVIKPFEVTRSVSNAGAVEAGVSSKAGKQTEAAQEGTSAQSVASQTREAVQQPAEVEREQLQAAVSDIQDFVQSVRRDINFALDDDSGRVVINVTEASSGDVIRQIPSEEALRLAENLTEIRSVLFEAEA